MIRSVRRFSFFILSLAAVFSLVSCAPADDGVPSQVCFHGQCLSVELARTPQERARGLQDRTSMDIDRGMLFIFEESGLYGFWMKRTLIPLDIIWLDDGKHIVTIIADIPPCVTEECPTYQPQKESRYVLEVNAGVAAKRGLKVGDQATYR